MLGIDFGTKKVGLALSDESGTMAFPHDVLTNDARLVATVVSLLQAENIGEIVLGHSLDTTGQENAVHQHALNFMTELTLQTPIPVHLEPEQFSTQQAIKLQGKNTQTDASAAAIILQSYLDKQKTTSAFDELNQ
jgi:putative Holliday junction resolvase